MRAIANDPSDYCYTTAPAQMQEVPLAQLAAALQCRADRSTVTRELREMAWFGVHRFGAPPAATDQLTREFKLGPYDPRIVIESVSSRRWRTFTENLVLPPDPSFHEGGTVCVMPTEINRVLHYINALSREKKACSPLREDLSSAEITGCLKALPDFPLNGPDTETTRKLLNRQLRLAEAFGRSSGLALLSGEAKDLHDILQPIRSEINPRVARQVSQILRSLRENQPPSDHLLPDGSLVWRWSLRNHCWAPAFAARFQNATFFDLAKPYFTRVLRDFTSDGTPPRLKKFLEDLEASGNTSPLEQRQAALGRYLFQVIKGVGKD
jgi:hypothetical protein